MIQSEEQIFIVYAITETPMIYIEAVKRSINTFKLTSSQVCSVIAKPFVLDIPPMAEAGKTLNLELIQELNRSLGAIVFIDQLKPNITYELGFFHGQGKPVLLILKKDINQLWRAFSDLAGTPVMVINKRFINDQLNQIETNVQQYLANLYKSIAKIPKIPISSLPAQKNNIISELLTEQHKDAQYNLFSSDYGNGISIHSWGGAQFNKEFRLSNNSSFQILIRKRDADANYSIYFLLHYINAQGSKTAIQLGITSTRDDIGFEANERNFPGEDINNNWCVISHSFQNLLNMGKILGANEIISVSRIRFRAGKYQKDEKARQPIYEIGFLGITGLKI